MDLSTDLQKSIQAMELKNFLKSGHIWYKTTKYMLLTNNVIKNGPYGELHVMAKKRRLNNLKIYSHLSQPNGIIQRSKTAVMCKIGKFYTYQHKCG